MTGEHSSQPQHRLLICGTRSFAVEVGDLASEISGVDVVGFVENMDRERCNAPLEGLTVHWIDDLPPLAATHMAVCALGTTHRSRFTAQVAAHGMKFTTLVHPRAWVSRKSTLGEGCIINVGVNIGADTHLGRHVLVNRGAQIGHHTTVGDFVSIMPGVCLSGNCRIGEATFIGTGAIILDNLKIGSHCIISAGAVVTKDVPDNVQVMGLPARIVKENIQGK